MRPTVSTVIYLDVVASVIMALLAEFCSQHQHLDGMRIVLFKEFPQAVHLSAQRAFCQWTRTRTRPQFATRGLGPKSGHTAILGTVLVLIIVLYFVQVQYLTFYEIYSTSGVWNTGDAPGLSAVLSILFFFFFFFSPRFFVSLVSGRSNSC